MDCSKIKKQLKKYLLHATEESQNQTIEEHLSVCTECREYLENIMSDEGRKALRRRLVPVLTLSAVILVVMALQLRQASCGVKKDPLKLAQATPKTGTAKKNVPGVNCAQPANMQEALECALKGQWVVLLNEASSTKSVAEEFSITASFPQEEGDVSALDKKYHYLKIASVLNSEAIAKAVNSAREKHKEDNRLFVASGLNEYLQAKAPATETSIVYFYLLTLTN